MLGSPVAHSRSPQLHLAAYRSLGLTEWTYDRIQCTAEQLPSVVGSLGPEWVGLSVTMPNKFAALQYADERTSRAELLGSANTLVRTAQGWRADNTDVDGVIGALGGHARPTGPAMVVGSGGTAPAVVLALAQLRVPRIVVAARNPARAEPLLALGAAVGVDIAWMDVDTLTLGDTDVVVSTIPPDAAAGYVSVLAAAPVLLDVIYDPWPTPLAHAVAAAGGIVVGGLQMLLNQAFAQVELFTGRPAPRAQMAAALG